MIQVLGVVPDDILAAPKSGTSLATWLETSAQVPDSDAPHLAATAAQVTELSALLARLVHHPDTPGMAQADTERRHTACPVVPALLARDRIMERFLPASPALADTAGPHFTAPDASAFGQTLGDLSGLDSTAMEGLRAQLQQPPPIDSGPDRLPETSQIRALMLQAQGLVLQYTLNGLSYQAQPDHPAWTLLNELDALRRGADDHGQFLDPALHKAASLAMQWLLEQENIDTALEQVNALLTKINAQLHEEQQSRREQYLHTLGEPAPDDSPIDTDWCVIKRDEEAIPYEVLGKFDEKYALLNQSATRLLEIPAQQFVEELDSGLIEEAGNFNQSFLERTANATLAASLNAIHTYTWQDPASGCLKRAALMDELERRLAHPVSAPPTCCALIEIPTMRPGPSLLPGDELAVLQKRSGELLLEMTERGEQCGRLSDVSFMIVFSPQDPHRVANRLGQLKTRMEDLHPSWKMNGAIVPLVDTATSPTPSDVLRRANQACSSMRQHAELALTCLSNAPPAAGQIDPLPFSSLYLRCQKIASCVEGALPHYEILLGIDEDLIPHHSSQSFVVMAEQVGNIHLLDTWVLQSALEWMDRNTSVLDHLSGLSVNLSGNSLTLADHVDTMVNLLAGYPHLTDKLVLEVTETAAIDNLDVAVRSLRKLRRLGCRVALDDFGSGYSSYGYLRNLPLDYLKIDGTYIRNILTDKTDQALTASMVDVAHALGLKVIAEYVDSEAAYAWLKALGVDYVQGYWVHEPQRLDTLLLH
jgi:EAL domain-containing protein (putative c-di-GMP-specific phosphodiesterase class I)